MLCYVTSYQGMPQTAVHWCDHCGALCWRRYEAGKPIDDWLLPERPPRRTKAPR